MPPSSHFLVHSKLLLLLLAIAGGGAACTGAAIAGKPSPAVAAAPARSPAVAPTDEVTASVAESAVTEVAVTDPKVLGDLAGDGWALGAQVAGIAAQTTADLYKHKGFRAILQVLAADVRTTAREFPGAQVTSVGGNRLFDTRWLQSKEMSFALIGVFNRLDRKVFSPQTCGEMRLLYRLQYRTQQGKEPMISRLPLTLNVVFDVDNTQGCLRVAKAWQHPAALTGNALRAWLTKDGPLQPTQRKLWNLKAVETNLQTIRVQSTMMPTMGGHVDYTMHVFAPKTPGHDDFAPALMENTPNLTLLQHDRPMRADLLAWLRQPEILAQVDHGVVHLPLRFLATSARTVAPKGLMRTANRPFRTLFQPSEFADLNLAATKTIRSPIALLRRLDEQTCAGCHHAGAIAGFHHVGDDAADVPVVHALYAGSSVHLRADLPRRVAYVADVAAGRLPDDFRPFAERQGVGDGYSAPCGLGDPGFAAWTCAAGKTCLRQEDPDVGACFSATEIGRPCEMGEFRPNATPNKETVVALGAPRCPAGQACHRNWAGFSLGACEAKCANGLADSACADLLDIDGFQKCLRRKHDVIECTKGVVHPALRACDAERPCRPDYVCARTQAAGVGACVPTYFLFQLRADGYPIQH